MGVTVELLSTWTGAAESTAFEDVEEELRRLEQIFSRFLPASDRPARAGHDLLPAALDRGRGRRG